MKNTKAWKRSIRSVCRSVKATEIYYSLPVACVVYFHSYLIERKRPAEMIFSHQTDYTRYWAACKPSNEQGKMHGKKNSNSWSHLFFFPLYTFRQKSFRSVNIVECYINFKLDTNIQNRSPPRMYEFLLGKIQQEKKTKKKLRAKYSENAFSFVVLFSRNFSKTPMPTERLCNNSAKVRKVIQTIKLYAQKCSTFIVRCVTFSANAAPVVYQLWLAFGSNNNNVMIIYML